ncbi:MAG: phosphomannomutase/phosphoglucomutase [Candidatus Babeliales bacterium]|jgi:phosphomannomutase|nr:MAG: Phosphoglucomutase/phosphomannomutase alpha/beta/alpha domain III [candidate division TM6 bacterium GW2011_GWF2_36_6]
MDFCIFREYDIRGVIGKELLIEETYELGLAIATFLQIKNPGMHTVLIGRDGRSHSTPIFENIAKACTDLGFDVIDLGTVPSPATYYAVKYFNNTSAIMITASHNPKAYNGIKIWGAWGTQIQEIKHIFQSKNFYKNNVAVAIGTVKTGTVTNFNIIEKYLEYLTGHFSHLKNLPIKAVVDCGNGAAGTVVPELIKRMNWTGIKLLFEQVDGDFPNHEADPTVPENMTFVADELKNSELENSFEFGMGLDGDCDRMCPMTKSGELVGGDKLLAIFAKSVLKQFPGATIVFDIKSSNCLVESLFQDGGIPLISASGHSIIKEAIVKYNAKLAGELSCHFFFNDRYFGYDDGIYAMMRLIEFISQSGKTLDELINSLPKKQNTPEIKIKCASEADKSRIVENVKIVLAAKKDVQSITIDGIRAQMSYGWGLLRASNTQPAICLRFESDSVEGLEMIKNDFYDALKPHFDAKMLKCKLSL